MTFADGIIITMDTQPSPLLDRVYGEFYHQRKIALPDGSVQTAEWDYTVRKGGRTRDKILLVKRSLKVFA